MGEGGVREGPESAPQSPSCVRFRPLWRSAKARCVGQVFGRRGREAVGVGHEPRLDQRTPR
jgi:hypothetical protein